MPIMYVTIPIILILVSIGYLVCHAAFIKHKNTWHKWILRLCVFILVLSLIWLGWILVLKISLDGFTQIFRRELFDPKESLYAYHLCSRPYDSIVC